VHPYALGLLNVEATPRPLRHAGALESAFAQLIERTSGPVVVWSDDEGSQRVASIASREVVRVGTREDEWRVSDVAVTRHDANFTLHDRRRLARGAQRDRAHNVADAAVVAVLAAQLGVSSAAIRSGLANFVGAPDVSSYSFMARVDVYESYAHSR